MKDSEKMLCVAPIFFGRSSSEPTITKGEVLPQAEHQAIERRYLLEIIMFPYGSKYLLRRYFSP